ncbi:hypothetical protein GCG54_00014951 [Colletotrichum gloeosporioides]|uniref:Uncharacterized protein n=1 Tax=Colletotrichum gloeosporioides TaxID=474922 RepID=A0A8H4CCZ0_COLGL|nr:uncharacterized protein GCG54_00014951 [Colletotrichum gloeosporioides]KAF3801735.1 hypothetical protein GCG54_00014951 [Colletotrichum gloeosporioides]
MLFSRIPFLLHALVETAGASSFILKPQSQLPKPSAAAQLVLQSFGGLLLSTNLICLVFLWRPDFDDTSRLVAASLSFWHVWPCYRAYVRLTDPRVDGTNSGQVKTLGGPTVHLGAHAVLFLAFLGAAVIG